MLNENVGLYYVHCFCHGDDGAGMDVGAFGNETLREVAIADGEVAVSEGDTDLSVCPFLP